MRFLKITIVNNFVKDKEEKVVEAGFIYPKDYDPHKTNVKAYKGKDGGGADYCIVECSDDEYVKKLLEDKNVIEITKTQSTSLIDDARPITHVIVNVNPKALTIKPTIKVDIENLLKDKGLNYDIT